MTGTTRPDDQRVVITGMGAITPVGNTLAETWEALQSGRSGAGRITLLDPSPWDCQIAAELKGFEPGRFLHVKELRRMSVSSQLAVIAADQAIEDSHLDLDREDRDRVGVLLGSAGGSSLEETERAVRQLMAESGRRLTPNQVLRLWPNMPSYFVAERHRLRGHNATICTACAASTQAIGEAAEVIRRGAAEVMITGGTESIVSETVLAGFLAMRALATSYNQDPQRAMRPFDAAREGFIPAQGAAILILESLDHARQRGRTPCAEILGYGVSNDAFHMIAPDPLGSGATLAMERALASSGISADSVDYINAHAASTPLGDLAETRAIKSVFGERSYQIPINSTKSMIGHMMGATGAVEAAVCTMTIQHGIIHPTINYEVPDPECDLDYVPNCARKATVQVALSNSFGLGGQNACLVLSKVERE